MTDQPSPSQGETPSPTPSSTSTRPIQYDLPARIPVVTYILLAVTVLVYLAQVLTKQFFGNDIPLILGMKVNELIISGQWWRIFTPIFLHADITHILFNMYALFVFGQRLERFYGHTRFLALYILAGLCGNIFSFYFQSNPSLGASTSVFGLVAAEGIFIYTNRKFFPNATRALREIIMIVAINLILGFSAQIDNWGHLGGLLGGFAFAWFAGPLLDVKMTETGFQITDKHLNQRSMIVTAAEFGLLVILAGVRIIAIQQ